MKWIIRASIVLVLAVLALAAYAVSTARFAEHPVGFQVRQKADADGRPINIGIWYPTLDQPRPTTFLGGTLLSVAPQGAVAGERLPVILLSHGNGGGLASHADLAMDLASAGYIVAAPMHPGDNYLDQSAAASAGLFTGRARQVRATLDYLLGEWDQRERLDASRIGAYGFSAGAFTVLTLIGATPDYGHIPRHCADAPEFICSALMQVGSPLLSEGGPDPGTVAADSRIRAAVLAAPGLGFVFGPGAMDAVQVPVQLWSGTSDETVPFASNAKIVRDGLSGRADFHEVSGATHFSFLAPCGLLKPPALCSDPQGFDREAFHAEMNAQLVRFFGAHLRGTQSPRG